MLVLEQETIVAVYFVHCYEKKKNQTNKLDKKLATFSEFALAYSPKRTMLFAV